MALPFVTKGLSVMDLLLVLFIGLKLNGQLSWEWWILLWPAYVTILYWFFENRASFAKKGTPAA